MTGTPNETRGEVALNFDGKDYVLRPTFEALEEIETKTGRGLVELAIRGRALELKLSEMAVIAAACIRAWGRAINDMGGREVTDKGIARAIVDKGVAASMVAITSVLTGAISGGYTASGEVRAAPAPETNGFSPDAD